MQARILAMVLAGGKGTRLGPLTRERSKPAVPFGGKYRIIDFVLSNLINSGIYSIYVLTQFKAQSLLQHLRDGWQFSDMFKNQFVISVPAQMRKGEQWYQGTSDAIFQNIHLIELSSPDLVVVFGADHVYRMDITQMTAYHEEKAAKGTVAALPIPVEHAERFGTIEIDGDWRIVRFHEKVKHPPQIPGRPGWVLASMGNYIFDTEVLVDELKRDADKPGSAHDFGGNMLPEMVREHPIYAYDFLSNVVPGEAPERRGYWKDVGTIEAYYDANMDLRSSSPSVNLYNHRWPLRTAEYPAGPTKFNSDGEGPRGHALGSIVSEGCVIDGAEVVDSVVGRRVHADRGALVRESIVMDNCYIGAGANIRRAILDKNAQIPAGVKIGYDLDRDRERYHLSDTGIVIIEGHRSPIEITSVSM